MTQDPNYSFKRGDRWARQLQETLWDYISALWNHQNREVHGKDKIEIATRKLGNLRIEAKRVPREAPELGAADRHLLLLRDVDRKNGQFLHHWLKAVQSAARKESLLRKNRCE